MAMAEEQQLHQRQPASPIRRFELERYFARYEYTVDHQLCCADTEAVPMHDLVQNAPESLRGAWDSLVLGYTETVGSAVLRDAIADLYTTVGPDKVHVGAPQELIYLAMRVLLHPGDRVICAFPGYQSLYEIARSLGCTVDYWPLRYSEGHGPAVKVADNGAYEVPGAGDSSEFGSWRLDPSDLLELLRRGPPPRLVVVNVPHNPTGAMPSQDEWREVVRLCQESGTFLLCDEIYRLLHPEGSSPLTSACDMYEKGITMSGVSKTVGMPGARIGWLATRHGPFLEAVAEFKDYLTICPSAPSELLTAMALQPRARESLLAERRTLIADGEQALRTFMKEPPFDGLFAWAQPAAGPICFPRLRLDCWRERTRHGPHVSTLGFCNAAAEEGGVMLLPSTVYGIGDTGHVRFGLGRAGFRTGLAALRKFMLSKIK
eukprot:gnl/TRDRNA2_/TRDRNA2_197411_c0_seq1.p1 gnl/TRDRNA2_/TRDRNA2_197411_c0~~gnl/TRDRNA2_/TRDRNA2_197411_c0_seq1.p1  ORF type:complete len:462 (-),score=71.66 gnl/TRDRNA2_/TRDRNA2_197411_c0_seq1:84-1379(-)